MGGAVYSLHERFALSQFTRKAGWLTSLLDSPSLTMVDSLQAMTVLFPDAPRLSWLTHWLLVGFSQSQHVGFLGAILCLPRGIVSCTAYQKGWIVGLMLLDGSSLDSLP